MKTNQLILLFIIISDIALIGLFFLTKDSISGELLIGLLIFSLLFTLRSISNQKIITNGNNKKN
jgi:hypothetical protein